MEADCGGSNGIRCWASMAQIRQEDQPERVEAERVQHVTDLAESSRLRIRSHMVFYDVARQTEVDTALE